MRKFLKVLFGYYKLYVCNDCHVYNHKMNLNNGHCPYCNGEVRKA